MSMRSAGGNPNVIVVVIDALRPDYLSRETAPTLHSLIDDGVHFERAFSTINTTEPSLASFYTGNYPRTTGLINHGANITPREQTALERVTFLQERLQHLGYETAAIDWLGRWHERGYDYYSGEIEERETSGNARDDSGFITALFERFVSACPPDVMRHVRNAKHSIVPPTVEPIGWIPDSAEDVLDAGLDRIDAATGPFYLFMHFWDTHAPYVVPEEYVLEFGDESDPVARYRAGISYVDDQLDRLVEQLTERELLEGTLLVVMADHGESLGEHEIYYDHHGLYDESIHVPMVLSHPDLPAGKRVNEFVQHVDLHPTILDFVGSDPPEQVDGHSLLPVIFDGRTIRDAVVAEEAQTQRKICIRTSDYKYIETIGSNSVCRGCHVIHGGERELYDLQADDAETSNLFDDRPDIQERLRSRLEQWRSEHATERAAIQRTVASLVDSGSLR